RQRSFGMDQMAIDISIGWYGIPCNVLKLKGSFEGDGPTLQEVVQNVSHPLRTVPYERIFQGLQLTDEEDRCISDATPSGMLSSSSTYNLIRILNGSIPVESRISGCGVPMVSAKQIKLICWIPPIENYCLNVDEASKGN
ncbi:hypothetical protein Taro_019548, partial [Colocasia esculenta]|nr:hypothetical protein [Colocasia esculenta]